MFRSKQYDERPDPEVKDSITGPCGVCALMCCTVKLAFEPWPLDVWPVLIALATEILGPMPLAMYGNIGTFLETGQTWLIMTACRGTMESQEAWTVV